MIGPIALYLNHYYNLSQLKSMNYLQFFLQILAATILNFSTAYAAPTLSSNIPGSTGNGVLSEQFTLTCDGYKVTLTTSCLEEQENDRPLCPSQKLNVEGAGKSKDMEYRNQINGGDQDYITEAACFKKEKTAYLVLSGTNFGNCAGCEWEDFYTSDGTYIGSTSGIYKNFSFKHKELRFGLRKSIKEIVIDKYKTADTGFINRVK